MPQLSGEARFPIFGHQLLDGVRHLTGQGIPLQGYWIKTARSIDNGDIIEKEEIVMPRHTLLKECDRMARLKSSAPLPLTII